VLDPIFISEILKTLFQELINIIEERLKLSILEQIYQNLNLEKIKKISIYMFEDVFLIKNLI
jgi:hypothetical protein